MKVQVLRSAPKPLEVEVRVVKIFCLAGANFEGWQDSRDGQRVVSIGRTIPMNKIEGIDKFPANGQYLVYSRTVEPISEDQKSRLAIFQEDQDKYRNKCIVKTVLLGVEKEEIQRRKRIREVRAVLERCEDLEKIEDCAKILGL